MSAEVLIVRLSSLPLLRHRPLPLPLSQFTASQAGQPSVWLTTVYSPRAFCPMINVLFINDDDDENGDDRATHYSPLALAPVGRADCLAVVEPTGTKLTKTL